MNLLSGGAAALFGEIMAPLYLSGTVRSHVTTYSDRGGQTRAPTSRDCLVQVDQATQAMRAADGFAVTDRALYVLAASLSGELSSDDQITVNEGPHAGASWRVAEPIDRDPAGAYYRCRAVAL